MLLFLQCGFQSLFSFWGSWGMKYVKEGCIICVLEVESFICVCVFFFFGGGVEGGGGVGSLGRPSLCVSCRGIMETLNPEPPSVR